jgi:hypothetical protein
MHQSQHGMELDRKTPVWRGYEQRLSSDPPQLFEKLDLLRPTADVLEDRARMNVIK